MRPAHSRRSPSPRGCPAPARVGLALAALLDCQSAASSLAASPKAGGALNATIAPRVIKLDIPANDDGAGGIIVADVNNDGRRDFIVTKPGRIAVHDNSGAKLWTRRRDIRVSRKSEDNGLPGWHGPGVQVADVDGDGRSEIVYLTERGGLEIADAATGRVRRTIRPGIPRRARIWEHLVIANFRGKGDRDLLLQTTDGGGYRMGRHLVAYALDELLAGGPPRPLWRRADYRANAHNGVRVADLDGDGRDEVLGPSILGPDGRTLYSIPARGHIDSIFVYDVRPDIPGLEVVALEEGGGNRVFLYNRSGLIWATHYRNMEPQNAAVGEFDPARPGLEIWCRSRFDRHQRPFLFDSRSNLAGRYEMRRVAPVGWTAKGVEVIFTIDWTGGPRQLAAAKERHRRGDVAIFDPLSGRFVTRFRERADRLYVADVYGDWREELIVLSGSELRIYQNDAVNPNPDRPRLWTRPHYRRSKMTWNYYSP